MTSQDTSGETQPIFKILSLFPRWPQFQRRDCLSGAESHEPSSPFPLSQGIPGSHLRIVGLTGDKSLRQRLLGLGFVKGKPIQILQQTSEGAVIVALSEDRIGLSPEMVAAIQVIRVSH